MRVLMLGWEFPPYFAGGVGVVCHALTKALAARDVAITYVMPSGPPEMSSEHVRLLVASQIAPTVTVTVVPAAIEPYSSVEPAAHTRGVLRGRGGSAGRAAPLYGRNLLEEVQRFSARLRAVIRDLDLDFDVIHAHDWTTFHAGLAVRELTGKPLIVHVHITEFDKSGGVHANPQVWAMEKAGMDGADLVVTVSNRVREQCIQRYGVNADKIQVVYNGVEPAPPGDEESIWHSGAGKIVLFLGRVTLQKGPDYFVEAARRVLEVDPEVTFIMAGSGDMLARMIERSAELGIGSRMVFTGFVEREEATRLYRMADVFVMPSVSEPFGIVPLEAMSEGVPVIVSRQSGVAEVVRHAIKVDFWDVDDLAGKILASLAYPTLARELRVQGRIEAERLGWDRVAGQMMEIYDSVCRR